MYGKVPSWRLTTWAERFWQDLQPTPGRLNTTLRMTLAAVLSMVLLLVWQVPFAALALYSIFIIGRESPSVTLRTGIGLLVAVAVAIAIELGVVIFTDNDPIFRVLSVAVITFLAGMIVVTTSVPALGSGWGLIYCTVISFWENHAPADRSVKNSLWLLAAFSVGIGCSIAVEYVFGTCSPAERLESELRVRYQALEKMFNLFAQNASARQRWEAASRVSRMAAAGEAGMIGLYNQIVDRNLDTGALPIGTRVRITMVAELMDDCAAFGFESEPLDDPEFRGRCARIAEQCRGLVAGGIPQPERRVGSEPQTTHRLLDRVEGTLHSILAMPLGSTAEEIRQLAAVPSSEVPLLTPGAIREKENIAFGLKISLCATICYILYHAIDWPGISTSVITVMVAGLTTTAALKQRLAFRLLGASIGGLILGLGATAFLFPLMDSIASFVIVVGSVAFLASWISGGPRFNYVGIQIAFAFYVVAFEGFTAPTELAPARDRLIGILFAVVVMWFVFDQIWPVRTVTAMRRVLASVLKSAARLFELVGSTEPYDQLQRELEGTRDRVGKNISALRTMSEAVEYEFGVDHEQHVRSSELILQSSVAAAALIWNQVAFLHGEQDVDFKTEPALVEMRRRLADHLNRLAEAVERKILLPAEHLEAFVSQHLLESGHFGEYARNTIARYEDLQALAITLARGA
jgi:multidrug resistance protein MdtO